MILLLNIIVLISYLILSSSLAQHVLFFLLNMFIFLCWTLFFHFFVDGTILNKRTRCVHFIQLIHEVFNRLWLEPSIPKKEDIYQETSMDEYLYNDQYYYNRYSWIHVLIDLTSKQNVHMCTYSILSSPIKCHPV